MSSIGWFAAGMCAAFLGQWLGMLWLAKQRERFYCDFYRRRCGNPPPPPGMPCKPQPHGGRTVPAEP